MKKYLIIIIFCLAAGALSYGQKKNDRWKSLITSLKDSTAAVNPLFVMPPMVDTDSRFIAFKSSVKFIDSLDSLLHASPYNSILRFKRMKLFREGKIVIDDLRLEMDAVGKFYGFHIDKESIKDTLKERVPCNCKNIVDTAKYFSPNDIMDDQYAMSKVLDTNIRQFIDTQFCVLGRSVMLYDSIMYNHILNNLDTLITIENKTAQIIFREERLAALYKSYIRLTIWLKEAEK